MVCEKLWYEYRSHKRKDDARCWEQNLGVEMAVWIGWNFIKHGP